MAGKTRPYHSYMLRLWLADGNGKPVWRCSLQNAHSGKNQGFNSLEAMLAYLIEATEGSQLPEESTTYEDDLSLAGEIKEEDSK